MSEHAQPSAQSSVQVFPPAPRVPGKNGGTLTMWQKGQSGNPGGRNLASYHACRRLAAEHSEEAMRALIELMHTEDDGRVRYMAAMAILERGCGKVRDHSNEDDVASRVDISALSGDDRAKLAELLRKALQL